MTVNDARSLFSLVFFVLALVACSETPAPSTDSGPHSTDAALGDSGGSDSGGPIDAGDTDAATPQDAGTRDTGTDAASTPVDAGSPTDTSIDVGPLPPGACLANSDCAPTEHCSRPDGMCDAVGTCAVRPMICPPIFLPVCGCNGTEYDNDCNAHSAGTSVRSSAPCH